MFLNFPEDKNDDERRRYTSADEVSRKRRPKDGDGLNSSIGSGLVGCRRRRVRLLVAGGRVSCRRTGASAPPSALSSATVRTRASWRRDRRGGRDLRRLIVCISAKWKENKMEVFVSKKCNISLNHVKILDKRSLKSTQKQKKKKLR